MTAAPVFAINRSWDITAAMSEAEFSFPALWKRTNESNMKMGGMPVDFAQLDIRTGIGQLGRQRRTMEAPIMKVRIRVKPELINTLFDNRKRIFEIDSR